MRRARFERKVAPQEERALPATGAGRRPEHTVVLAALIIFCATYLFLAGAEVPFLKLDRPGG
ncbi:MAG TPA: hypothetical protein VFE76_10950, partial [Myxococcales bacterium]|nr:hypothetical protein [Myxococcales bacterium]